MLNVNSLSKPLWEHCVYMWLWPEVKQSILILWFNIIKFKHFYNTTGEVAWTWQKVNNTNKWFISSHTNVTALRQANVVSVGHSGVVIPASQGQHEKKPLNIYHPLILPHSTEHWGCTATSCLFTWMITLRRTTLVVSTSSSELSEDSIPSSSAISWETAHNHYGSIYQVYKVLLQHTCADSNCSFFSLNLTFMFVKNVLCRIE